jgi:hypothetical protein
MKLKLLVAALIIASLAGGIVGATNFHKELGKLSLVEVREFGHSIVVVNTTAKEVLSPMIPPNQGGLVEININTTVMVFPTVPLPVGSELRIETPNGAGYWSSGNGPLVYKISLDFPSTTVWQNVTVAGEKFSIKFFDAGYGDIRAIVG